MKSWHGNLNGKIIRNRNLPAIASLLSPGALSPHALHLPENCGVDSKARPSKAQTHGLARVDPVDSVDSVDSMDSVDSVELRASNR